MPDELPTNTDAPVVEAATPAVEATTQAQTPVVSAQEKTGQPATTTSTPEGEAPRPVTDPAKMFARKSSADTSKPSGEKPKENTPEPDDEEAKLPPNAAPHVRNLAKANDEKKREINRLKSELEAAKKQPASAGNDADIASLKAQIEASKADKAEIERMRKELDESRQTLRRTNIQSTPEYRQEHGILSRSAKDIRGTLAKLGKDFGINASLETLVTEMRAGPGNRPTYNSVLAALRDAGDLDGEDGIKENLKAILNSQDRLYALDQKAQQEAEAWQTNRKGEISRAINATRQQLGSQFPIYNKQSQEWMALPEESKTAISTMEKNAEDAAHAALEMSGNPGKLADAAYQNHLSLQIANASHQNALAQIEKVTVEFQEYKTKSEAELNTLRSKLAGYERAAQGNPGGVARSNPSQIPESGKVVTDPAKMFASRLISANR